MVGVQKNTVQTISHLSSGSAPAVTEICTIKAVEENLKCVAATYDFSLGGSLLHPPVFDNVPHNIRDHIRFCGIIQCLQCGYEPPIHCDQLEICKRCCK